jgi:SAM-dependent methyltransferase
MGDLEASIARDRRDWLAPLRAVKHPAILRSRFRTTFVKTRFGLDLVGDAVIDRRYGKSCGGTYKSRFDDLGSTGTSSTHYYRLRQLFCPENVVIGPQDVLVDVGCGKGRVLNFWLNEGLQNRIVGLELDERFATFTAQRLAAFPNVDVIAGDGIALLPHDGTLFYLFNPFRRPIVERFKERLMQIHGPGSGITVVYYMCQHADVFENDPAWMVTEAHGKTFHRAVIIRPASVKPQ